MASKSKLEVWSTIVQTAMSVATFGFALWAFFFSSLSQQLEESFRTDLNLAKIELIEAKKEKSRLEVEHEDLAESTRKLLAEKNRLTDEIAAAQAHLTAVQQDRSKYATSTLALIKPQFAAMVTYELELNSKIAEICARYIEHLTWLRSAKQIADLEAKLKSDDLGYEQFSGLSNKIQALRDKTKQPEFWIEIPNPPELRPNLDPVVIDARTAAYLRADEEPDDFNKFVHKWLMEQIVDAKGTHARTGGQFAEHAKHYQLLQPLLPEEQRAFNELIDGFLIKHPEFQNAEITVAFPSEPDTETLVALGKKIQGPAKDFEKTFLAHLKSVGITM